MAKYLKTGGKLLNWPVLVGTNAYANYVDWDHGNGKPGDQAVANALGGIGGGQQEPH